MKRSGSSKTWDGSADSGDSAYSPPTPSSGNSKPSVIVPPHRRVDVRVVPSGARSHSLDEPGRVLCRSGRRRPPHPRSATPCGTDVVARPVSTEERPPHVAAFPLLDQFPHHLHETWMHTYGTGALHR